MLTGLVYLLMFPPDKAPSKEVLIKAIEAGEPIPDHLLPVGIHRTSAYKWRAHLCTGKKKFSGPPRDSIKEAVEDRKRLCEETGVEFVLYGKQSHAKPQNRPAHWAAADHVAFEENAAGGGGGLGNSGGQAAVGRGAIQQKPNDGMIPRGRIIVKKESEIAPVGGSRRLMSHLKTGFRSEHIINILSEHDNISVENGDRPERALIAVDLDVEIDGIAIFDRFLWSVLSEVHNDAPLQAYLASLLIEFGLSPTDLRLSKLSEHVLDIFEVGRDNVLMAPSESRANRKSSTLEICKISLTDLSTGEEVETLGWNCFSSDFLASEFAKVISAEKSIYNVSGIVWQIIDASIKKRAELRNSANIC